MSYDTKMSTGYAAARVGLLVIQILDVILAQLDVVTDKWPKGSIWMTRSVNKYRQNDLRIAITNHK